VPDRKLSASVAPPVRRQHRGSGRSCTTARRTGSASNRVFPEGYDDDDWFRIIGVEQAIALGRDTIERDGDRFDPRFRRAMLAALQVPIEEYVAARARRFRYARDLDMMLTDIGLLVTPTLTIDGWLADGRLEAHSEPGLPGWAFNTDAANLTGRPAVSIPVGVLPNGLPFGLQVIGPRFGDSVLLDVAQRWEAARLWPLVGPGFTPFPG
jgi:Asp-tRNA(Asn)/Glu-tRNA(Gln) amidotransferase A subunit family amidase